MKVWHILAGVAGAGAVGAGGWWGWRKYQAKRAHAQAMPADAQQQAEMYGGHFGQQAGVVERVAAQKAANNAPPQTLISQTVQGAQVTQQMAKNVVAMAAWKAEQQVARAELQRNVGLASGQAALEAVRERANRQFGGIMPAPPPPPAPTRPAAPTIRRPF